jgi:hypothetical protein
MITGLPSMYVSTSKPPTPTDNTWFRLGGFNPLYMMLCPSDDEYLEDSTYFVGIQGYAESEFNIILEPVMAPPLFTPDNLTPDPANCVGIAEKNLTSTHTCLEPGVSVRSNFPEIGDHYYLYNVTGCNRVVMILDAIPVGLDVDIYVSTTVVDSMYGTSDYAAYSTGDDYLIFTICPDEGQTWIPLWVTIDAWVSWLLLL